MINVHSFLTFSMPQVREEGGEGYEGEGGRREVRKKGDEGGGRGNMILTPGGC